ncbi:hypothetical protein [Parendozoicomonas haliclonae]|nr:hypothetical protein [Parendozoicomonas haliclonae]
MRTLAGIVMSSRFHACVFALLMAALPMLFWLSASAVTLVILRRGNIDGLVVGLWALLPALIWAWAGQPLGVFCILVAMVMAMCLRKTQSWSMTLMSLVPSGLLSAWGISLYYGPLMEEVRSVFYQLFGSELHSLLAMSGQELDALIESSFLESVGFIVSFSAVLALMIGRKWQDLLYNPGGFQRELYLSRFSPVASFLLLATVVLVSFNQSLITAAWQPFLLMPFLVMGSVLVHALVWKQWVGKVWLLPYYLLLLVVYPLVVFIACLDSLFDFRARLELMANKVSD